MTKLKWICITCLNVATGSCTKDKFESDPCAAVSYSQTIRPLINAKCAVSGCHVEGFLPGDFTRYETLLQKARDGKIKMMVFDLNLMPPSDKLTIEEVSLLKCWVESGAAAN